MVVVVTWALALVASLVLLWFGAFRVLAPTQIDSALCVGVDLPWFLGGELVNLAAVAVALGALRAGWWSPRTATEIRGLRLIAINWSSPGFTGTHGAAKSSES